MKQTLDFSVRYKDFVAFEDKSVPRSISISEGSQLRGRIHVEQLDDIAIEDAAMLPPAGASPVSPGTNWLSMSSQEETPVHRVKPSYPQTMASAGISGPVTMLVLVSRNGTVKDIQPLYSSAPELMQAAIDAIKQWTYTPILRHGKPVDTMFTVVYMFKLSRP